MSMKIIVQGEINCNNFDCKEKISFDINLLKLVIHAKNDELKISEPYWEIPENWTSSYGYSSSRLYFCPTHSKYGKK